MSKELKMLYSYEDYKKNEYGEEFKKMSSETADALFLSLKMDKTKEEEDLLKEMNECSKYNRYLNDYTIKNHKLLDLYNDLKNKHDDEQREYTYRQIGVRFCELQVLIESFNNEYNK